MKERVLIITEAYKPNVGGVETHVDDLMQYLRRNGHKVTIITYQPLTTKARGAKVEKAENLEIHRLSWFGLNLRPQIESYPPLIFLYIFPWLFLYSFFFMLKRHKEIDNIHAHGLITAVIAVILARTFRKKSILTPHTIFRLDEHWFLRTVLRPVLFRIDMSLVIAPGAKVEFVNIGIPEEKVNVFTHWVDLDVFKSLDKQACRRKLGLPADKFIFLFLGRFHEQKNIRLLLKASAIMNNDNIIFVFVGNGPLEEDIRRAQQSQKNIILLGPMDNREVPVAYSAADVFWGDLDVDYLSRVTIESFACGLPSIVPDRIVILNVTKPVTQSMFADAVAAGILKFVPPEPEALAAAITYYYNVPQPQLLSQNCRQYALQKHSDKNAEVISNAYRRDSSQS